MAGPPGEAAPGPAQDHLPQPLGVGEEGIRDEIPGRYDGPRSTFELVLELTRRPPGVSGVDAQRLQVRDQVVHGCVEVDDAEGTNDATEALRLVHVAHVLLLEQCRVEGRQPEGAVQRDRSALEKVRRTREVVTPPREHRSHIEGRGLIEDDTERARLVVLEQEDDGAVERLLERRCRDKEPPCPGRGGGPTDGGGLEHSTIVARDDALRDTLGGMATVALTEETFAPTVQDSPIVLIDFWAAWCGPCRTFAPVFEKVSDAHSDIVFGKVDTEAQPGLAQVFQISSIPTLMAIRDGVVLYSQAGALPEQGLEQLIQAVRDVDMEDVRASIAEEKAGASAAE